MNMSAVNAAASASCTSARHVVGVGVSGGGSAVDATTSSACISDRHSAMMLDSPWVGEGADCTCLLVGVVGVGEGRLEIVGEWFAATGVDPLVGVVIVDGVVCVAVGEWFAAVDVFMHLGGRGLRWSGSWWVGMKSPSESL